MARKIKIDFGRRICRLALAASAMFIYVSLKLLTILAAFTGTVLGTAKKNGVWINRRNFVNLGRSKFELSSAHEKIGVWTGPKLSGMLSVYLLSWN